LKNRNWKGSKLCVLCKSKETVDHLLFSCPLAKFAWAVVGEALGWEGYPRSMQELITSWLPRRFRVSFQIGLACFAALAWAIWLARNNMCIRK
jgi:hypothetical protein